MRKVIKKIAPKPVPLKPVPVAQIANLKRTAKQGGE
jgi:hypothetical protein